MRANEPIQHGRDTEIQYQQFSPNSYLRLALNCLGVLSWPLILPLAGLARLSDFIFITCSQLLALVPYMPGLILRYEFYRFALRACGKNVQIGFGTVFIYRDISIGSNVLIGMYNTIHHCDFADYVLTAEGCRFLSGAQYHHHARTDIPMALQGGTMRRIKIARDVWIGANAVIMADVAQGAIVAAGAVVNQTIAAWHIVGGVPAKTIKQRQTSQ